MQAVQAVQFRSVSDVFFFWRNQWIYSSENWMMGKITGNPYIIFDGKNHGFL